jgi:hypothetical protein
MRHDGHKLLVRIVPDDRIRCRSACSTPATPRRSCAASTNLSYHFPLLVDCRTVVGLSRACSVKIVRSTNPLRKLFWKCAGCEAMDPGDAQGSCEEIGS